MLEQGGQQSTNEQSGRPIGRLLMSAGLRLIDCSQIGKIDRLIGGIGVLALKKVFFCGL
jgi:hypothetical protein